MKVALAQINTTVGDFDGNVAVVRRMVQQAVTAGAELVICPELTVTGYSPRDLVEMPSFIEKSRAAVEALLPDSAHTAILVGLVARNEKKREKGLLNAAFFLQDGAIRWRYAKRLLPTYDVFDEGRYFAPGRELGLLEFKGRKLGVTICEDIWNDQQFWEHPQYDVDPVEELIHAGAEAIVTVSASPYGWDKEERRMEMLQFMARRHQVPFYYCNLVGGNDDLVFAGRSVVLNAKGEIVAQAKLCEEELLLIDDPRTAIPISEERISEEEAIYKVLSLGTRDYTRKCGFRDVIIGLSGGIDSSLTAAIAVEALGADHVWGVLLPSPYTSPDSNQDALHLAENLGIRTDTIPIDGLFAQYKEVLGKVFSGLPENVTEENIQARIRGNILMAISNKFGRLVLSTGNKSEIAVGYCTLYGDMSGGLAVLSDVPKTMVYRLARWINRDREIIPSRVLTRPPSAELKPDQSDQDVLPPYEVLDEILQLYIEEHHDSGEIVGRGFDKETVDRVIAMVVRNEYKRKQMPIGLKICKRAFGMGRRFPVAKKGF